MLNSGSKICKTCNHLSRHTPPPQVGEGEAADLDQGHCARGAGLCLSFPPNAASESAIAASGILPSVDYLQGRVCIPFPPGKCCGECVGPPASVLTLPCPRWQLFLKKKQASMRRWPFIASHLALGLFLWPVVLWVLGTFSLQQKPSLEVWCLALHPPHPTLAGNHYAKTCIPPQPLSNHFTYCAVKATFSRARPFISPSLKRRL